MKRSDLKLPDPDLDFEVDELILDHLLYTAVEALLSERRWRLQGPFSSSSKATST
ncbi:MAG: hypothetical protein M1817_004216, partial [Caeruleum heppii]